MALLAAVGFSRVRVTQRFDCFAGTSKEAVARQFGVHGVNVQGVKSRHSI